MNDDIQNIRRKVLSRLVDEAGGQTNLAQNFYNLNPTYISQLLRGGRGFGERSARNFEKKMNLDIGFLDNPFNISISTSTKKPTNTTKETQTPKYFNAKIIAHRDNLKEVKVMKWNLATQLDDRTVETSKGTENTIALIMHNDSMEPRIQENSVIIIDPDAEININDIVLSKPINDFAIIGRFVRDGSGFSLMPVKDGYSKTPIEKDQIFGRIVQVITDF